MENRNNRNFENIQRMREIAQVYEITKQNEKSERYHKNIVKMCDRYPKNERMLQYKIYSLNSLKKSYKSLETTRELLNLNPKNIIALLNIAIHINGGSNV